MTGTLVRLLLRRRGFGGCLRILLGRRGLRFGRRLRDVYGDGFGFRRGRWFHRDRCGSSLWCRTNVSRRFRRSGWLGCGSRYLGPVGFACWPLIGFFVSCRDRLFWNLWWRLVRHRREPL